MESISDDDSYDRYEFRGRSDRTIGPVHAAVCDNDLATLQTLLAESPRLNDGMLEETPLMIAVVRNKREAARMLLEAGADPICLHEDGVGSYTPLSVAASRGRDEI
ncbi:ankyrin repeat domain-containing protein, partial [Candidatus Bathyarchaeota archaeon]|nr:ankyrin repeat domain-containing protein [Candidatus Bathyarchaeota archaeon]